MTASSTLIPDDVARFIIEKIDSVAQIEALLLLRDNCQQQWDVAAVAKRLYIDDEQAAEILARLEENQVLASKRGERLCYRYQPRSTALNQILDRVAEIYSKHLVPVTNLIHSKPKSRVQEFADAFKFRKD
ncbi:MAG TPA: hypothetical protein VGH22_19730 [Candidatus Binatia bacterium]|jgi:hypothetical protein